MFAIRSSLLAVRYRFLFKLPSGASPDATVYSPITIRHSLLAIRCRFGSAGASPSHYALRFTHYASRFTHHASHLFYSFHGIIATNTKMVRSAKCGVRYSVQSAMCLVRGAVVLKLLSGTSPENELRVEGCALRVVGCKVGGASAPKWVERDA